MTGLAKAVMPGLSESFDVITDKTCALHYGEMPYSSPQAIDRNTIYREWRHLLPGAMGLCGTAGYINSVLLSVYSTPVSHMSGAVSHLGVDIAHHNWGSASASAIIVTGFLFGAVLAGACVGAVKLVPSRRFGAVLMVEGTLLFASTFLLTRGFQAGAGLAAVACGLQNGMSSSYCGLMIRTTHVSGVVTDLGVMLGHFLRHRRIVIWKFKFLVVLLGSFAGGGLLGAWLSASYGPGCLIWAATGTFASGLLFFVIMQRLVAEDANTQTQEPRTSIFPDA